jgi:hypothetical protein
LKGLANFANALFLRRKSFDDPVKTVERCHLGLYSRVDDAISTDAFPTKVWEYLGLGSMQLSHPLAI